MRASDKHYKPAAWILFDQAVRSKNLKTDGHCLYLQLSKKNYHALRQTKKAWGLTWEQWATEILELIEEHG